MPLVQKKQNPTCRSGATEHVLLPPLPTRAPSPLDRATGSTFDENLLKFFIDFLARHRILKCCCVCSTLSLHRCPKVLISSLRVSRQLLTNRRTSCKPGFAVPPAGRCDMGRQFSIDVRNRKQFGARKVWLFLRRISLEVSQYCRAYHLGWAMVVERAIPSGNAGVGPPPRRVGAMLSLRRATRRRGASADSFPSCQNQRFQCRLPVRCFLDRSRRSAARRNRVRDRGAP